MCLTTNYPPQIVEEDFHGWKILSNNRYSPYLRFNYQNGKEYTAIFHIYEEQCWIKIEDGLHFYTDRAIAVRVAASISIPHESFSVYPCVASKGSTVYHDSFGRAVSDKLIVY